MNDRDRKVVLAMLRYGGGFVQRLADACWVADEGNLSRIKSAFPEIWGQYEKMASVRVPGDEGEGVMP